MVGSSDSPSPQPPPVGTQRPKVIYVMGQGKSGSTILGVALGNCADVFFAGELSNWLLTSGKPVLGGVERTRFWLDVSKNVDGAEDLFGREAFTHLERALSAVRLDREPIRQQLRKRYQPVTESLYRSIASTAEVTHIVDTSHLPLRARELQSMDGIDVYLIFLVRQVESVVASHTRDIKRQDVGKRRLRFLSVNAHLWWTYLLSIIVFLRHPHDQRLLLRHEDFVANPEGVLREILDCVGSAAELPELASLRTGLPLKANGLIRADEVSLKAKPAAPNRASRLMRLAQQPWAFLLTQLRPAATGATPPQHVSAADFSEIAFSPRQQ